MRFLLFILMTLLALSPHFPSVSATGFSPAEESLSPPSPLKHYEELIERWKLQLSQPKRSPEKHTAGPELGAIITGAVIDELTMLIHELREVRKQLRTFRWEVLPAYLLTDQEAAREHLTKALKWQLGATGGSQNQLILERKMMPLFEKLIFRTQKTRGVLGLSPSGFDSSEERKKPKDASS